MSGQRQTSRLLIDEAPLQVLPSLAAAIGLNEAIVLQQIHFLVSTHHAKTADDHRWVRKPMDEWAKQFAWWSMRTIKQVFGNLKQKGLLITANLNPNTWDHTLWYRIDYEALETLTSCKIVPIDSAEIALSESATSAPSDSAEIAPSSLLENRESKDSIPPEVASAPPVVNEKPVAPKAKATKPKNQPVNQFLKDELAVNWQGISPKEATGYTGLLANRCAAVWKRKLEIDILSAEQYQKVGRSIARFVSWMESEYPGIREKLKSLDKFEEYYREFANNNGKPKPRPKDDFWSVEDSDDPATWLDLADMVV